MRIAYLTTDFGIPVHGNKGASIHVRELATALAADGHDVEIFTSRAGGGAPAGFPIPVHEIGLTPGERRLVAALHDDPEGGAAVAREIRSMLYATSFLHQARPLLEAYRPDAIYERHAVLATAGMELARHLGVPHLLEVNAPLSEEHARHRDGAYGQTVHAIERAILAGADRVIAVSEPLRQWILETGVAPGKVVTQGNGVDLARFTPDVEPGRLPGAGPVIGFVGTLRPWHGTATLVRAFAILARDHAASPAPRLLIVGDGPQRAELERLAVAEGIAEQVTVTGMVPYDAMPAWIARMDVAVAPYDALPGFYFSPLKLFEYMAAGRPIVAAAIGQVAEVIRDGETGVLYPAGDAGTLAARLRALLADYGQRARLGRAARIAAERCHGWERNARLVASLVAHERHAAAMAGGA